MAGVTERAFIEELANPHSRLITADNLHSQAIALHERTGRGLLTSLLAMVNGQLGTKRTERYSC